MEVLVVAAAVLFVAFAATIVVQGVRFYQGTVPARDLRHLEAALEEGAAERARLRAALEEIVATRYAAESQATHARCVAIASTALGITRRG